MTKEQDKDSQMKKFQRDVIRHPGAAALPPFVAITTDGRFCLSKACSDMLDGYEHVHLHFDKQNERVGIEPVKRSYYDGFKILRTKYTTAINVRAFLSHCQIRFNMPRRYPVRWSKKNNMIIVNISRGDRYD